jgi:hypothetical protein
VSRGMDRANQDGRSRWAGRQFAIGMIFKEEMMDQRRTSGGMSVTNLGPIEMVREGMTVVDSTGEKVGKVEGLKMGDPGAATEAGNELQDTGLLGDIAEALVGDEREPDVPGPLRARLLQSGYIKVDGGFLIETDRYVPADRIASVGGDTVHLKVPKDQLIKEA